MLATDAEEPVDPSDELMFLNLGGGNEVGRSCHILQYKGKTVMVRQWEFRLGSRRMTDIWLARCRNAPGLRRSWSSTLFR